MIFKKIIKKSVTFSIEVQTCSLTLWIAVISSRGTVDCLSDFFSHLNCHVIPLHKNTMQIFFAFLFQSFNFLQITANTRSV